MKYRIYKKESGYYFIQRSIDGKYWETGTYEATDPYCEPTIEPLGFCSLKYADDELIKIKNGMVDFHQRACAKHKPEVFDR